MYAGAKGLFFALSKSRALKRMASAYGMATPTSFARRFIAGETIEEAIAVAAGIQAQGLLLTLDSLGESVRTLDEANAATREYGRLLDVIVTSGIERNVSLKLTQLGAGVDRATCVDNLRRILEQGRKHGVFVRIDMENSPWTQLTLDVFET
ncbi:MAG: proline dehydrogenase family protein, partial [Vicinamibacterales bacterium]